jgi:hypothetical protein
MGISGFRISEELVERGGPYIDLVGATDQEMFSIFNFIA